MGHSWEEASGAQPHCEKQVGSSSMGGTSRLCPVGPSSPRRTDHGHAAVLSLLMTQGTRTGGPPSQPFWGDIFSTSYG